MFKFIVITTFLVVSIHAKMSVIMLGDSLTSGTNWDLDTKYTIVNMGIGGDTTKDILNRLELVLVKKPAKVFLMCGVNDLLKYPNYNLQNIFNRYIHIVCLMRKRNIEVIIQSIVYTEKNERINKDIEKLNRKLKKYADEHHITYLDIATNLNQLQEKYTYDGLHLNGKGYTIWKQLVKRKL